MIPTRSYRRARALFARVHALLFAIVLLVGIARSGARYFTCPMMGASFAESSCCAGKRHAPLETPAVDGPECCTSRTLGTLPESPTISTPEVAPVALAAVVPPFDMVLPQAKSFAALRVGHRARAGPPSAKERRAELMVWIS